MSDCVDERPVCIENQTFFKMCIHNLAQSQPLSKKKVKVKHFPILQALHKSC